MTRAMLDTSAYSAFKRGVPSVVAALRRPAELLVPVIAVGELKAGFESGTRRERNRRDLAEFLRRPRVRVVRVTESTTDRYALLHAELRRTGKPVPANDLWIASLAMEHGAELLTLDRDFERIPQLLLKRLWADDLGATVESP